MDCILTTYFTSEKDPQRPNAWANDDFSIIENGYSVANRAKVGKLSLRYSPPKIKNSSSLQNNEPAIKNSPS